ncbi:N-acetylmuramoyl-L-alanine amidase [Roseovarius pacificus]|uniref:N-acetylmuramoyl-L-alanine amidase n=1 Tax=Roseovarius pacificus TaxID=337701 RepID=UPI004039E3C0
MSGAVAQPDIVPTPSPNFGPRRQGALPDMVVLHYTAMENARTALERLCDAAAEVSAHYLICEAGTVWQMVDEEQRAWHAGAGQWGDVRDVNSRSIGIELANTGAHPFPEPQMRALEALLQGIMRRWSIPATRIIGHSDMAPDRKSDPGPRFDWQRLALGGLSIWPRIGGEPGDFLQDAVRFGYAVPDGMDGDAAVDLILPAFRQRFRPWASGGLDATDRALMADLAARFPVDRAARDA